VPLRALIFDFDGTILDTETPEVDAWRTIFRSHGLEYPDEYWMHAIGRGADQIDKTPVQLLSELAEIDVSRADVLFEYERLRMSAIDAAECRPGIRNLISQAMAAGLRLGIASSSHHAWVDRLLSRLGLFDSFSVIACADDVPRAKPFPDLYLSACGQLGVDPADAAAIEDSPNGIRAARDAGLRVVAIPNSCTIRLDLGEADLILDSAELLSLERIEALSTS
jgi:HAD superfamily hydrolase (TIGR01509 family)